MDTNALVSIQNDVVISLDYGQKWKMDKIERERERHVNAGKSRNSSTHYWTNDIEVFGIYVEIFTITEFI